MGKRKERRIQKSYEVLALLGTCQLALDALRPDHWGKDAGNVNAVLDIAHRLAGELHDELEAGGEA